jgi:hypothetical protein
MALAHAFKKVFFLHSFSISLLAPRKPRTSLEDNGNRIPSFAVQQLESTRNEYIAAVAKLRSFRAACKLQRKMRKGSPYHVKL